jgi:hypothetical protein
MRMGDGDRRPVPVREDRWAGAGSRKPGEPQDRMWDATSPWTWSVEKAVEVGWKHEDGTRSGGGSRLTEGGESSPPGVDTAAEKRWRGDCTENLGRWGRGRFSVARRSARR